MVNAGKTIVEMARLCRGRPRRDPCPTHPHSVALESRFCGRTRMSAAAPALSTPRSARAQQTGTTRGNQRLQCFSSSPLIPRATLSSLSRSGHTLSRGVGPQRNSAVLNEIDDLRSSAEQIQIRCRTPYQRRSRLHQPHPLRVAEGDAVRAVCSPSRSQVESRCSNSAAASSSNPSAAWMIHGHAAGVR